MKYLCAFFYFLLSALASSETAESLLASATRAINSGLWDIAALRLEHATEAKTLSDKEQCKALLLLAESLIRGNLPDKALTVLENPLIAKKPQTAFWLAQALAGKGHYTKAVEILLPIAQDPQNPLHFQAALTASSLKLSLSLPEESLTILDLLTEPQPPEKSIQIKLKRIEILIDLKRIVEAREFFQEIKTTPKEYSALAKLLNAVILLKENKPEQAEPLFKELLANPQDQTTQHYNQAALGYADSLAAQGATDTATSSLFIFIQQNQTSPLLAPIFLRIINWLPKTIISEENQTLKQLDQWLPKTAPVNSGLINTGSIQAIAALPTSSQKLTDLEVFSLYTKALGLRRVETDRAKSRAAALLHQIRILAPRHFLTPRSLLELGKWQLTDGNSEQAFSTFISLQETTTSPSIKGEATFLCASIAFEKGDLPLATQLYEEAAKLLPRENANNAALNSALTKLRLDPTKTILISTEGKDSTETDKTLNTELELEKALVIKNPSLAKTALDTFLNTHPDHPRAAEARLSIAASALAISPPDLPSAQEQIKTLLSLETKPPILDQPQFAITYLRLLHLSEENEATVTTAQKIISTFPDTPTSVEASLILGKTLFKTGNYNQARLILEKLATYQPKSQRSQAALLLAARSAALGATEQSREEALILFDKTIAIEGPLTALAKLEKARLNISLNRLSQAIQSLEKTYNATTPEDPARLTTGLLLAEAIYAQGDTNTENLSKTLEIYQELLKKSPPNSSRNFRIHYLYGLTLERLPDPKDPSKTRISEALSTYFTVLDRPTNSPPVEWEWFYKSGFRALLILEKQERWQAAISFAEKIASFGGPRTEDAATRSRQLRLKHMIWQE